MRAALLELALRRVVERGLLLLVQRIELVRPVLIVDGAALARSCRRASSSRSELPRPWPTAASKFDVSTRISWIMSELGDVDSGG